MSLPQHFALISILPHITWNHNYMLTYLTVLLQYEILNG